jgi:probable rRNA maturation factor
MKKIVHYRPVGPDLRIDFSSVNLEPELGFRLKKTVREAVVAALKYEGFERDAELSVIFCDNAHIQTLNLEFRDKDAPTDVLSFPIYEVGEAYTTEDVPLTLGDIVISLERAAVQAEEIGNTYLQEVAFLTVHSVLHLLGYDHERSPEDEEEMFRRQKEIVKTLDI